MTALATQKTVPAWGFSKEATAMETEAGTGVSVLGTSRMAMGDATGLYAISVLDEGTSLADGDMTGLYAISV